MDFSHALSALCVALLVLSAPVFSLEVTKTPKDIRRGATVKFKYVPEKIPTNASIYDTVRNTSMHVIDNVKNGQINWTVPEDLEARGGYFLCVVQGVNNGTLSACSKGEFEIKEREVKTPPPLENASNSRLAGIVGPVVLVGFVVVLGTLGL